MEARLSCDEDIGLRLSTSSSRRVAILRNHLESGNTSSSHSLETLAVSAEIAPKFSGGSGTLTVVDNRTGKKYEFEISEGGTLKATDFQKVIWCSYWEFILLMNYICNW